MKACTYRLSLDELLERPIGLCVLIGAEGEDDQSDSGSESEDETGDEDEESEESGEDENDKSKGKKAAPSAADKKIAALEDEKDRHFTKRQAAEERERVLIAENKQLKKDGVTDEATKTRLTDLEGANVKLTETNTQLRLANAFLQETTHSWEDPKVALKLADLSQVEFEDDGTANGLTSALDKLAKASPYLLKAKVVTDETKKPPAKTGDQPKSKPGSEASRIASEAKLRQKYTGLRR